MCRFPIVKNNDSAEIYIGRVILDDGSTPSTKLGQSFKFLSSERKYVVVEMKESEATYFDSIGDVARHVAGVY